MLFHKPREEHVIHSCQSLLDHEHQDHRALQIPLLFLLFYNSHLDRQLKIAPNCESNQVLHELLVLTKISLPY